MPIVSHRAEDFDPQIASDRPSPGSYWVPLLLVILACAGYILWRRGLRPDPRSFGLAEYSNRPAAVRLSVDDDGVSDLCLSTYSFTADPRAQLTTQPASTSFIMNNDSNESLPSHALSDLPIMPEDHSTLASPQPPYALPDAHLQASSVALLPWFAVLECRPERSRPYGFKGQKHRWPAFNQESGPDRRYGGEL
ncbi:hypothetical protein DB88DRAFT_158040 [Papiliotrema laurentii]|uniref:Uncharacterized protein n=1 Tax=Papiliotrema laurentii TaxID=5418 RepID=A0AAD9FUD7_PAPLA|nr:hypothetical protein DB88DRAFT_158040 [Papiliotrema laurentii]